MTGEVILREFQSEAEAALAAAALRANGIDAELRPAKGMRLLRTTMAGATSLIVRAENVERAGKLLDGDR